MKKGMFVLLICVCAFAACKKENELERVQNLMVGTYDVSCHYSYVVYNDSTHIFNEHSSEYTRVWDISLTDSTVILLDGTPFQLLSDFKGNTERDYYNYISCYAFSENFGPNLHFFAPDSLLYGSTGPGHFGPYTRCTGKKRP